MGDVVETARKSKKRSRYKQFYLSDGSALASEVIDKTFEEMVESGSGSLDDLIESTVILLQFPFILFKLEMSMLSMLKESLRYFKTGKLY